MTVVIYLSIGTTPHLIGNGEQLRMQCAGAIRAVGHWISARSPGLLAVHVNPTHPHYRQLQMMGRSGVVSLARQAYSTLEPAVKAAARGELSVDEATRLFDEVVERSISQMSNAPCDTHSLELLNCIRSQPDNPLHALAKEFRFPPERASRAFKEATGMTLRSYCVWRKLCRMRAGFFRAKTLTEIAHQSGFADLAHMTHIHNRTFGFPPSRIFRRQGVLVVGPRSPD